MICLGFTSSTDHGSVAVGIKNKKITQLSWDPKKNKSEILTAKISQLLKRTKVNLDEIDLIAVDRGPGSFTGTRVAVNVARTLAFGLGKKIFTCSSLDLMAANIKKRQGSILTLIDAHRDLYYFSLYSFGQGSTPRALSLDEILNLLPQTGELHLLGRTAPLEEIRKTLRSRSPGLKIVTPPSIQHRPQAKALVQMALSQPESEYHSWSSVEPSYVRSPDVVEKLQKSLS